MTASEGGPSHRLVYVQWLDSFGCSSSWQPTKIESCSPMVCHSVGWLLFDSPECKVIVPHLADRQGCGDMTIPTVAITKMVDLSAWLQPFPLAQDGP